MGMGLGSKPDPGCLVANVCFLGGDDKGEEVLTVEEPAGTKNVEYVEDAMDVNSG